MSIISSLQTFLRTFPGLETNAPFWVDFLGEKPTEYSVSPLPGAIVVETYLSGSSLRRYPFALSSTESTADDLERMQTNGFFEAFAQWLEDQSNAGNLPTLDAGQTAEEISATGWGFLLQEGDSNTGIYQIQCQLLYLQDAN